MVFEDDLQNGDNRLPQPCQSNTDKMSEIEQILIFFIVSNNIFRIFAALFELKTQNRLFN